jgi:hypothetical protein
MYVADSHRYFIIRYDSFAVCIKPFAYISQPPTMRQLVYAVAHVCSCRQHAFQVLKYHIDGNNLHLWIHFTRTKIKFGGRVLKLKSQQYEGCPPDAQFFLFISTIESRDDDDLTKSTFKRSIYQGRLNF